MRKLLLATLILCSSLAEAQVVVREHGVVRGVRVTAAPPAIRMESPPAAPSSRHQWIAGYWGWGGGRHVWIAGHWTMPPAVGYVWEPARWKQVNGAWIFYDGHWRATEAPDPAVAYQPPPPPVQEVT